MQAKFSGYREKVIKTFNAQGIVHTLGIKLIDFGEGWLHTRLIPGDRVSQQHGYVHAGAIATMADLSSGFASYTLLAEEEEILTIEFKTNFLRPAIGDLITCRAQVLKPGKRIYIAESEVYGVLNGAEKLVAKATVTLAVVDFPTVRETGTPLAQPGNNIP